MEPNRLLAALLGEFGRSLVAVSELMENAAITTVTPAQLESFAVRHHSAAMAPLVAAPVLTRKRAQKPMVLPTEADDPPRMTRTKHKILISLAQFGRRMTITQIGFYTGLSHKGGSFSKAMTELRQEGFVEGTASATTITNEGRAELGDFKPLPHGHALFEFWCAKLGTTAEKILRAVRASEQALTLAEIGQATELSHTGGSFSKALTGLRKMELVEGGVSGVRLTPAFKHAIGPTVSVFDTTTNRTVKLDASRGHVR